MSYKSPQPPPPVNGRHPRKFATILPTGPLRRAQRGLGHLNERSLMLLAAKGLVKGLNLGNEMELNFCEACVRAKHRSPFLKASQNRATSVLKLVHLDLCGPFSTESYGGKRYFMAITDDKSRKIFVYFLRHKNEALSHIKEFKARAERETGRRLIAIRSDNGGEFISHAFSDFLQSSGIQHQTTVAYKPQQNGVAERVNGILVERAKAMLHGAGMSRRFWAEAVATAAYLRNRGPTRALNNLTPQEAWSGRKPHVKHVRTFGCEAWALIPKEKRTKLNAKAVCCIPCSGKNVNKNEANTANLTCSAERLGTSMLGRISLLPRAWRPSRGSVVI
jgi:transposase InsO family protein